jgi:hypothetical protein
MNLVIRNGNGLEYPSDIFECEWCKIAGEDFVKVPGEFGGWTIDGKPLCDGCADNGIPCERH